MYLAKGVFTDDRIYECKISTGKSYSCGSTDYLNGYLVLLAPENVNRFFKLARAEGCPPHKYERSLWKTQRGKIRYEEAEAIAKYTDAEAVYRQSIAVSAK
jgi:hypothetical protein